MFGDGTSKSEVGMRIKDVMNTKVESVRPTQTVTSAAELMRRRGIHHLVVVDHQQVVGILTQASLDTADAQGIEMVEDAMIRHVATGGPAMTIREAANRMRGRSEGALVVMEEGKLAGIVTVSDLLEVLGGNVNR